MQSRQPFGLTESSTTRRMSKDRTTAKELFPVINRVSAVRELVQDGRVPYHFGRTLRRYRKAAQLTQHAAAATVSITQSAWSKMERGDAKVSIALLFGFAAAIGVAPSTIVSEAEWQGVFLGPETPMDK